MPARRAVGERGAGLIAMPEAVCMWCMHMDPSEWASARCEPFRGHSRCEHGPHACKHGYRCFVNTTAAAAFGGGRPGLTRMWERSVCHTPCLRVGAVSAEVPSAESAARVVWPAVFGWSAYRSENEVPLAGQPHQTCSTHHSTSRPWVAVEDSPEHASWSGPKRCAGCAVCAPEPARRGRLWRWPLLQISHRDGAAWLSISLVRAAQVMVQGTVAAVVIRMFVYSTESWG